jgi:hypothetical protein
MAQAHAARRVAGVLAIACLCAAAIYFGLGRWLRAAGWAAVAVIPLAFLLPRGRRAWFALAAITFSIVATLAFVFGIDLYLHHKFLRTGGYNVWGYRGPAVGKKRPGETRLVMLGGSVTFGYGVPVEQTIPAYLEARLNDPPAPHRVSVVNLGMNSEGAYSFQFTMADYEYLHYDSAVLYSGYNDLLDDNYLTFRQRSAVFRLTGYLPILPIIPIREWLHIDNLSDTMHGGRVVFRPGLADRYTTEATETALRITKALEQQLGRLSPAAAPDTTAAPDCDKEYVHYCHAVMTATEYARNHGKQVFVVSEPYITPQHVRQQKAIAHMIAAKFAADPLVHYIDLGRSVDLHDTTLCYDGMHLTAAGNARAAAALAPRIRESLGS